MASRSRPAALEPASSTILNSLLQGSPPPPLKRRKTSHDGETRGNNNTASGSFTIKPHASSSQHDDDNLTLHPIALLPRSRLPLSWLDPCPSSSPTRRIQSGRLFIANIPTLERDLQRRHEPVVLAARLAGGGDGIDEEEFYVVERVKRGIYAVCALGSWVEEGDLVVAAKGWRGGGEVREGVSFAGGDDRGDDWLDRARVADPLDFAFAGKGKLPNVRLVFGSGLQRNGRRVVVPGLSPETSDMSSVSEVRGGETGLSGLRGLESGMQGSFQSTSLSFADNGEFNTPTTMAPDVSFGTFESTEARATQSSQELLDALRTQYLEALYISKTSVAYFAKGPLSRTRAAFQSVDEQSSLRLSDLTSFYRECILPVKKMDVKYKDSLPEVIQNAPVGMSDDEAHANPGKSRKRKPKKPKLGRNGLYPDEDALITKWWRNRSLSETSVPGESSRQDEIRRLVADLRLRETQLQVLLILETISLEAASRRASRGLSSTEIQAGQTPKRPKEKKPQDLNVLLELLVDRLCIWHAVSFGDILHTAPASGNGKNESSGKPGENDKLRDFCTEVIIPFYAGRLPDQCKTISRKLGGPVAISPSRPAISRSKTGPAAQPGAAIKRSHPQKPQRTLQRVLTDEKMASSRSRAPSLSRSTTAPSIPGLKREASEPALLSLIAGARGGIQKPKRVDNREVDLNAVAKQHETKLKKMNALLEQKKELDAAINALRKPNRELATKEVAESVDKRVSTSGSARKAKHPVRNPFAQGVQVMATPKGLRKKDCEGINMARLRRELAVSNDGPASSPISNSDIQLIPSSSIRPSQPIPRQPSSSRRATHSSVHETPSRGPSRLIHRSNDTSGNESGLTPVPKEAKGSNLFKIPKVPNTTRKFAQAETSPTALRKTRSYPNLTHSGGNYNNDTPSIIINNSNNNTTSTPTIQETPPRPKPTLLVSPQQDTTTSFARQAHQQPSKPIIFTTPIKNTTSTGSRHATTTTHNSTPNPELTAVGATPEKSIYDQLGWNDDDYDDNDDDDDIVMMKGGGMMEEIFRTPG
ncbi:hypothetical protein FQN50_008844 [Emmonsiellopsis sp. PD_5]|nr:hypothetical protein FQN50_008844 [Emmonsiellopsis sp. PD_5]